MQRGVAAKGLGEREVRSKRLLAVPPRTEQDIERCQPVIRVIAESEDMQWLPAVTSGKVDGLRLEVKHHSDQLARAIGHSIVQGREPQILRVVSL